MQKTSNSLCGRRGSPVFVPRYIKTEASILLLAILICILPGVFIFCSQRKCNISLAFIWHPSTRDSGLDLDILKGCWRAGKNRDVSPMFNSLPYFNFLCLSRHLDIPESSICYTGILLESLIKLGREVKYLRCFCPPVSFEFWDVFQLSSQNMPFNFLPPPPSSCVA